MANMLL